MLKAGIISSATSTWSFPVYIATRKDDKPRFCKANRMLKQRMKADRLSLSKIQEIFEELPSKVFFTTSNFFSGHWQISNSEACKEKTAFMYRFGTYQSELMPFGLMIAPSPFQRIMIGLLGKLPFVKLYLDDVIFFSSGIHQHLG